VPELPEVETIVRDLNKKVLNRTFIDIWTDWKKMIKRPQNFNIFKKELKGKRIEKIKRKGKNILFILSSGKTLLIHQKLTGHLLLGKWGKQDKIWKPLVPGPLADPVNRFLHLIFWLDDGKQLALSDLRKFAKVELVNSRDIEESPELKSLGPDPLERSFTFSRFAEILKRKKGKIKQVLMDQTVISGIGNIYSDEILWEAKIHPFKEASELKRGELGKIFKAIKEVLKEAIKLRGESFSNFRDLEGKKGYFDKARKVYRREGEKCPRCGTKIERKKIGGRSAHFCPKCQNYKTSYYKI
jgi:formamidopyrimidine-DNA glycosylase